MLHLFVVGVLVAHAQSPERLAEVRRLAAEPDTVAEALSLAAQLSNGHPDDPHAFAVLVEAVEAAGGPVLGVEGQVETAWFVPDEGIDQVVLRTTDGTFHVFEARTGQPLPGASPVRPEPHAAGEPSWRVEAGDGQCVVLDGQGRERAELSPCDDVAGFRFSPDRQRVVTVHEPSADTRSAALWSIDTGRRLADLGEGFNPGVRLQAAFSRDGRHLLLYSNAGGRAQYVWDARTGERGARLGPYERPGRFTPDGEVLVLADVDLQAVDPDDGVVEHLLAIDGAAWQPREFLRDGRHLAVQVEGQTVLWDVKDGSTASVIGGWSVRDSDGRRVLAGRPGGPVRVVDTVAPGAVTTYGPVDAPRAVAVTDDAFAVADGRVVRVWDEATRRAHAAPHARWLSVVDGAVVASTGAGWSLDGGAQVHRDLFRYPEQIVPGPGIGYSWDPKATPSSRFRPLDGPGGAPVQGDVQLLAAPGGHHFSADGKRFAAGFARGAGVWDTATGQRILSARRQAPEQVALSADGRRLAASWDGGVLVIAVEGGREVGAVELPEPAVALALSPSGGHLLAGTAAGRIALVEVGSGAIAWLGGHRAGERLAFSPDGAHALTAGSGRVGLWSVEGPVRVAAWDAGDPSLARFAPGGATLVFVGRDDRARRYPATAAGYRSIACAWIRPRPASHALDAATVCGYEK